MYKLSGQIIGLILGSCISPSWLFLNQALMHYFNLQKAVMGPEQMIAELQHFRIIVEAYPNEILFHLVPMLIVLLLCSGLFVAAISHLFGFIVDFIAFRAGLKPHMNSLDRPVLFCCADAGRLHSPWTLHLHRD